MRYLVVAVAGSLGAVTRYAIGLAVGPRSFPWATLAINVTGSFLIAAAITWSIERRWSPELTAAVTAGFLGAYTTFSTFSWESLSLIRSDRVPLAAAYVGASTTLGLLAAWAGLTAARAVLR